MELNLYTYETDHLGHDVCSAISSCRFQAELEWKPSLQFEGGIEKAVKWYLDNK